MQLIYNDGRRVNLASNKFLLEAKFWIEIFRKRLHRFGIRVVHNDHLDEGSNIEWVDLNFENIYHGILTLASYGGAELILREKKTGILLADMLEFKIENQEDFCLVMEK
jgi:hypothetical protein